MGIILLLILVTVIITFVILIRNAKDLKEQNDRIYYKTWAQVYYRDKFDVG